MQLNGKAKDSNRASWKLEEEMTQQNKDLIKVRGVEAGHKFFF
jgi:hypothetical protein